MTKLATRFRIAKKGYDRFEVDRKIIQLEQDVIEHKDKLKTYQSQVDVANSQNQALKERYDDLVSKLSIREKAADEISRLALKEANAVIDTANQNADIIVQEALSTAKILLSELAKISQETTIAKDDLRVRIELLQRTLDEIELPELPHLKWLNKYNQNED